MEASTDKFIANLINDLQPISSLARRLSPEAAERGAHGFWFSHRPHVASEAYALRLFSPLARNTVDAYLQARKLSIPATYLSLLRQINGMQAFELDLFGVTPSIAIGTPRQNRTEPQPLDIGTANQFWRVPYKADAHWTHIGSAPYDDDKNVGYFMTPQGQIQGLLQGGVQCGSWHELSEFLEFELLRCERIYPVE